MSSLFFDLQNGISGDMAVASLLSLFDDGEGSARKAAPAQEGETSAMPLLIEKLKVLALEGYELSCKGERRNGLWGNRFSVLLHDKKREERSYFTIRELLLGSGLLDDEKKLSLAIFENLAQAESRVHGIGIDEVHFHEIGAVDSIIDIVSFSVLLTKMNPEKVYASPVPLGSGTTRSRHGLLPLPAPATLEILRGLPVYGSGRRGEITTPTGAAMIKAVVQSFGPMPAGTIRRIGMGFGKSKRDGTNALRVFEFNELLESNINPAEFMDTSACGKEMVAVIEATIDDSTPEEISFLQDALFADGALDVFITPVYMKKNRPGVNLTAIIRPEDLNRCADTILLTSSSFGLRYQFYHRRCLERRIERVDTEYGPIAVKLGILDGRVVKVSPEYEDCRRAAIMHHLPVRTVFERARFKTERRLLQDQGKRKSSANG